MELNRIASGRALGQVRDAHHGRAQARCQIDQRLHAPTYLSVLVAIAQNRRDDGVPTSKRTPPMLSAAASSVGMSRAGSNGSTSPSCRVPLTKCTRSKLAPMAIRRSTNVSAGSLSPDELNTLPGAQRFPSSHARCWRRSRPSPEPKWSRPGPAGSKLREATGQLG